MKRAVVGSVFLITSSFAVAAPLPKGGPAPYTATHLGDRWVYELTLPNQPPREIVEVVTAIEAQGGLVVTVSRETNGKLAPIGKLLASEKGLFRLAHGGSEFNPPLCLLPLPFKPGTTWETVHALPQGPERPTWEVDGEVDLRVPAGSFKAVKVLATPKGGPGPRRMLWYAPGVGLVRSESVQGEARTLFELKSFTPGKR
jgi:hypothetical protein